MALTLFGDVKIVVEHQGFSSDPMFRFMFNTAFIPPDNCITKTKMELSPEDIRKDKDKKIKKNFKVKLYFKDFCKTCKPHLTEVHELCPACVAEMGSDTIN